MRVTFSREQARDVEGIIELRGRKFAWWTEHDEDHGAPWEEEDGHGPVSGWERREKRPGELVLNGDRHSKRFYDFAHAVQLAKEEGWDAPPFGEGTVGQRAHRAALADFNRLRDWCADHWWYVGVLVQEVEESEDGPPRAVGPVESVWGIESDAGQYLHDTAEELVSVLAPEDFDAHCADLRKAEREADEEAASLMEREALELVDELAKVKTYGEDSRGEMRSIQAGELDEWIERAREIVGND